MRDTSRTNSSANPDQQSLRNPQVHAPQPTPRHYPPSPTLPPGHSHHGVPKGKQNALGVFPILRGLHTEAEHGIRVCVRRQVERSDDLHLPKHKHSASL